MNASSWLATWLDWEMLEVVRGIAIESQQVPADRLPRKSGRQVAAELGGRYLLRYLADHQLGLFGQGSSARHYTTPSPYAPNETISYLALPPPFSPRRYVLLLDPAHIPVVQGPQWIRGGRGIQYVLPDGFPAGAVVIPGGGGGGWELEVR